MQQNVFPVIDAVATGENIVRLRKKRGLTVRDLQTYFGFEEPRAIYKWQHGASLPTVDNLYALSALLEVSMDEILVPARPKLNRTVCEQQAEACCSAVFYCPGVMDTAEVRVRLDHFPFTKALCCLPVSHCLCVGFLFW